VERLTGAGHMRAANARSVGTLRAIIRSPNVHIRRYPMRIVGTLAVSLLCTVAFAASASPPAAAQAQSSYQRVQYNGDQDRRNDNADRDRDRNDYGNRDRDDARDRDREGNRDRDRHRWEAGDRVDREYLGSQYVIGDWGRDGLSRPPRGHEWIRVGDEFMLVRVQDQKIAKVIFGDPRRQR
jgi:Ni/Co efflux regulator RcnB